MAMASSHEICKEVIEALEKAPHDTFRVMLERTKHPKTGIPKSDKSILQSALYNTLYDTLYNTLIVSYALHASMQFMTVLWHKSKHDGPK